MAPTSGLADGGYQRCDMTEQTLMTVKEVATELRLGHTKTYELVASGQLAAVRTGRSVRVTHPLADRLRVLGVAVRMGSGCWACYRALSTAAMAAR